MHFKFESKEHGIVASNGMLTIRTKGQPIYIREQSLETFSSFYRDWQHGLALIANDSFLEGWTNNQAARGLLELALETIGVDIEKISNLTFSQLQLLLVSDGQGGAGLIFQLHNTYPKPLSSPLEAKTVTLSYWKTLIALLPQLIVFFRQEYMPNVASPTQRLSANIGLYLVSCIIWLLRYILTFLGTPKNRKPL
jgi:hypothetical protein